MKLKVILLFSITLFYASCSNEVNITFIGDYEFIRELTPTINENPTIDEPYSSDEPYWITENYEQLINTCCGSIINYQDFNNNCIKFKDITKEDLIVILSDYDIIISEKPIKKILRNTAFTKQDGCDYYMEPVEVVLEDTKKINRIFLYKVKPKGQYRTMLCP